MIGNFRETTVEDLIFEGVLERPIDGNHGSIHPKTIDFVPDGIPFIMASDLKNGKVDTQNCSFLPNSLADKLRKGFARQGDVLISHKATIGRSAIVGEHSAPYLMLTPQVTYYRVLDKEVLDPRYLYFYFNSKPFLSVLEQWAGAGSTRAYIGITDQRKLPIIFPDILAQRAIVHLLGALDDKIELNRQMNETLEALGQAIFKDWFVTFGPVRRKMEGATDPVAVLGGLLPDPTRATEVAALFPDSFGDDGLPEGCLEAPFSTMVEIIGGGTPKTSIPSFWEGDIPWFSVVDTPSASDTFVFQTEKSITHEGLSGSSARLIPPGTTIITARGTVGNLAISGSAMAFNQSCYALRSSEGSRPYFTYLATKQIVERLKSMAHGSVFSTITRQTFESIRQVTPSIETREAFENIATPIFERISASTQENRTLAETRDYLLPKLMSGEVRVRDAEKAIC